MTERFLMAAVIAVAVTTAADAGTTPRPADAEVYFISPADGATLTNPVTIRFGLKGMGIAPAGIELEGTGHHHLLINLAEDEIDFDNPMPADERQVHFGGGQTEVTMELPVGTHELRLLFADHNHIPHEPPLMSEPITVTVSE